MQERKREEYGGVLFFKININFFYVKRGVVNVRLIEF